MVNSASARKLRRHNLVRLQWRLAPRVFIGCAATSVLLALSCMNIFREPSVTGAVLPLSLSMSVSKSLSLSLSVSLPPPL